MEGNASDLSARRPPSRASSAAQSELSIDDLSLDRRGSPAVESETMTSNGDESAGDATASGMESKLQLNLRAQQAHYARQRRLFEDLRADAATATAPFPSACYSSPTSSANSRNGSPRPEDAVVPVGATDTGSKSTRFKLELPRRGGDKWRTDALDDEEKDEGARAAVQRVKDRALADYKRRIACYHQHQRNHPTKATHQHQHNKAFVEELEQQEASNDALRRQLELLRRLQVDNNRFRVENRTLRERNNALNENLDVRDREIQLLREEVADKSARINRDQASLASAAQTSKKLKTTHKQLAAAHSDIDKLREVLEDALKAQEEVETKAQEQLLDAANETKRLKKANKQLKQRENALHEDANAYRSSVEELEQAVSELSDRMQDLKRERNKLTAQLADKSAQYERYENSTAECVHKLQEEVTELQRALTDERNKLEKTESEREALETQLEHLESCVRDKDERFQELERELLSANYKFQERRRAYREHVSALEEKMELSISNQRADAETISILRRQCEAVTLQASKSQERVTEMAREMRAEVRGLRRALDSVRKYVEQTAATRAEGEGQPAMDDTQMLLSSPQQRLDQEDQDDVGDDNEEDGEGRSSPRSEFQVTCAAASALRHAVMDSMNELQRAQHVARQQVHTIASQRARMQDMERRLREDAVVLERERERERERRAFTEQAREIALKEKAEVMQWGEQACRKADALENKLKRSEGAMVKWVRKIEKSLHSHHSNTALNDDEEAEEWVTGLLSRVDKRLEELVTVSEDLKRVRDQQAREIHDLEENQRRLESESDTNALEAKRVLAEVEALHLRNVEEVKKHMRQQIDDIESEKQTLADELVAAKEQESSLTSRMDELLQQLTALESDIPVLAAVAHLFAATVRPLIQQVSDLIVQKRLLRRENAEYTLQFGQIKCVGQVLKEMLPSSSSHPASDASSRLGRRCREIFRRAVIAVFAINRLRQFATPLNHNRDADSRFSRTMYGISTALLTSAATESRTRAWSRSLEAPSLVIKVLPLKETVAKLPLRLLLKRLRSLHITEMLACAMETDGDDDKPRKSASSTVPNVGGLVLQVLSAMDASTSDLLMQNVSGTFHCRALLERRRRHSSHQASRRSASGRRRTLEYESDDPLSTPEQDEDGLPVVELIQQRIIALGKRVEDLHFQRNTLQKENYEFQFQLEQQALVLSEMERLTRSAEELQKELAELREHSTEQQVGLQTECDKKDTLVLDKTRELEDAREQIESLERQLKQSEDKSAMILVEKSELEQQIERLKQQGADEEAKADKTRADARKQQEETRQLKQAIKRAHELYQKAQTQLEHETMEKAALQASSDHLRLKYDQLERELREEKRREVERSFDDGEMELVSMKSVPCTVSDGPNRHAVRSPRSHMAVSFEDLTVKRPRQANVDDSDEDDASCAAARVSDARSARHVSSNEQFMREWRRLDMSTAFLDAPTAVESDKDRGEPRDTESPSPASPPPAWLTNSLSTAAESPPARGVSSLRKPWTRAELARTAGGGRGRRAVEIDKVNAAVHHYMDRIDDKLSKMYGIPPSAAIARSRGADDVNDVDDVGNIDDDNTSTASPLGTRQRRRVFG